MPVPNPRISETIQDIRNVETALASVRANLREHEGADVGGVTRKELLAVVNPGTESPEFTREARYKLRRILA